MRRQEKDFGAAMAIAEGLLSWNLITKSEHRRIIAALIGRFRPVIGSLQETAACNTPRNG